MIAMLLGMLLTGVGLGLWVGWTERRHLADMTAQARLERDRWFMEYQMLVAEREFDEEEWWK